MKRTLLTIFVICFVLGPGSTSAKEKLLFEQLPETFSNSISMKFVRIGPGTFQMGQLDRPLPPEVFISGLDFTREGDFDEKPVHTVTVTRAFYMGVCEVTNLQYELFDPAHKSLRGKEGLSNDDDEAVINVSCYDAQAFCRWLSDKEGLPYRLPSEAEWEYACRAGTKTNYYTGETLPKVFHKNARRTGGPTPVSLVVEKTPPNRWGLYDMHGNVEEWCYDWYGPYMPGHQTDPVGYERGNFRVTRGGSHGSRVYYLRSANRMGTLPAARNWMTGFRIVIGVIPETRPLKVLPSPHQRSVEKRSRGQVSRGPDPDKPYFKGPRKFVKIPTHLYGPVFASHNHGPGVVACPNGDLLAGWFSTVTEGGREPVVAGSRLRWDAEEWEPASQFWDTPDRNETGPGLWFNGGKTIYHFGAVSFAAASRRILFMRTSTDSGATWSGARILLPEFTGGQSPSGSIFRMKDDSIALTVDYAGSALWLSRDEGLTWNNPGGTIAGIHGGVAQLGDGRLIAFGRGHDIDRKMPKSTSTNLGRTWYYSASDFPPIGGQQRLVLLKLEEGPLFFASFADHGIEITDASGATRTVRGLYAALSEDGGKTWPYRRLISDDGPGRPVETTAGGLFTMSQRNGEYRGYMTTCQSADGIIHLLTSRQHYAFNLTWLKTPSPAISYPTVNVEPVTETFNGPQEFDCQGWADYHAYKGGFNGKGQYTVNALGPYGGINRIVGEGSFKMDISVKNIRYNPSLRNSRNASQRRSRPGFTLWLNDARSRTLALYVKSDQILLTLKDKEGGSVTNSSDSRRPLFTGGDKVTYSAPPRSLELRLLYSEQTRQIRVFYGLDGDKPTGELPVSKAGLYYSKPLSETTTVFLMFSSGSMDLDHFEIKPLNP